jgi:hypothetical protein
MRCRPYRLCGATFATGPNRQLSVRSLCQDGGSGGYANPVYRRLTTAQLQTRRLDLYGMVTLTETSNGVPAYIYHGQPLPQQDEIKSIEVELNRRYQIRDKSAQLIDFWPQERPHVASGSRFESAL